MRNFATLPFCLQRGMREENMRKNGACFAVIGIAKPAPERDPAPNVEKIQFP